MTHEQRLAALALRLPRPAPPGFDYLPLTIDDHTVYLSAQIAKVNGEVVTRGRVGDGVSFDQARQAMRVCALQGLAWLRHELGSLDRVRRVLRMNFYICCTPGFEQMSDIADVGSELFGEVFGDAGRHARTVLGVVELPRNAPCMFDATLSLETSGRRD